MDWRGNQQPRLGRGGKLRHDIGGIKRSPGMQHQPVLQGEHQQGFESVAVLMGHRTKQRCTLQGGDAKLPARRQRAVDQVAPASAMRLRPSRGA